MAMYIHGCTLSPLNIYCCSEQTLIYKILILQSLVLNTIETALTEIASILYLRTSKEIEMICLFASTL